MARTNMYIPAERQQLRLKLDNLYACMEVLLQRLTKTSSFLAMCSVVTEEGDYLNQQLQRLLESYRENLPIAVEEPHDVTWQKEQDRIQDLIQKLQQHKRFHTLDNIDQDFDEDFEINIEDDSDEEEGGEEEEDTEGPMSSLWDRELPSVNMESTLIPFDFPGRVVTVLKDICSTLDAIMEALHPVEDSDIYCEYSTRELYQYTMRGWKAALNELLDEMAFSATAHHADSFGEALQEAMTRLKQMSPHCIDIEKNVIYREGLGRLLWRVGHSKRTQFSMTDVLSTVKTIEYYSNRLQASLTFLDKETSPEDEMDEAIKAEHLRQETLQNQLEKAHFRIIRCNAYYASKIDDMWIRQFLADIINGEHSAFVCEKMKDRKLAKFVHQIVGDLYRKGMFEASSHGELVDAIGYTLPRRQSRIDYMRKGVDDVPEIQEWIRKYQPDATSPAQLQE